jgi:hypothetical protein
MLMTTQVARWSVRLIYFVSWLTLALVSALVLSLLPNLKVLVLDPDPVVSFRIALLLLLGSSILLTLEWYRRQYYITQTNGLPAKTSPLKKSVLLFLTLFLIVLICRLILYPTFEAIFLILPISFLILLLLLLLLAIFLPTLESLPQTRRRAPFHIWTTNILAIIITILALFSSTALVLNCTGPTETETASLTTNRHIYYLTYTEGWDEGMYGYTLYQCDRYDIFCKDTALDLVSNDGVPHGSLQFDATKNQVIVSVDGERRFIKE